MQTREIYPMSRIQKMEWWQRADKVRRGRRLTLQTIADRMHKSIATVGHWFTGKRSPDPETLVQLSAILGVSLDTIMTGSGFDDELGILAEGAAPAAPATGSVPVLPASRVRAWLQDEVGPDEVPEGRIPMFDPVSERAFAVRVEGDAMNNPRDFPTFPAGSVVIVDPDEEPRVGDIVLIEFEPGQEPTLKQWIRDGGIDYGAPLNPRFPLREILDISEILGVVLFIAQARVRQ